MTPIRTILVAFLTLVAAFAGFYNSDLLPRSEWYAHALWHLAWSLEGVALSLALALVRGAWKATGFTAGGLLLAQLLALGIGAGNVLSGAGASGLLGFDLSWSSLSGLTHFIGEMAAGVSVVGLLLHCLVLLGVGVRGALRPAAYAVR